MTLCRHKSPSPCPWCLSQDYLWRGDSLTTDKVLTQVPVGDRTYTIEEGGGIDPNPGLCLWPCSVALARLLSHYDLAGLTVLELGPGTGLPGLVAAAMGAHVTYADDDRMVVARLGDNLKRNGLRATIYTSSWAALEPAYDCVIGSEVTYTKLLVWGVADVIRERWTKRGPCLLTESDRDPQWIESQMPNRGVRLQSLVGHHRMLDGSIFAYKVWTAGEVRGVPRRGTDADARLYDRLAGADPAIGSLLGINPLLKTPE